ncbi:MAG TPA: 4Fe-4S dicluster domain-containing protein [Ignavibacteria bacterium]|nr:heterodisulfide reductase [Bacteroidota bacterium]HRI84037.1 4Fe-4S dicluster domain-containing protein [Ignavibacteria bacterium]HRJ99549.1 4Fe-4S dicluster domain-containing protein [Ignavibacteria bacterium]
MTSDILKDAKKLQTSFIPSGNFKESFKEKEHDKNISIQIHERSVEDEITERTFQDVSLCYQCGKCSAGCPVRYYMDIAPNKVVRLIQLGYYEEALNSDTPWLCAGCLACSVRCPKEFDLARFMDAVREIALEKGVEIKQVNILKFHNAFLDQIKNHGRSYEAGLVADYKMKTLDLFQDVDSAPGMFLKGKLILLPHNIKNRKEIKRIFKKTSGKN